jgi:hypothetical protein
MKNSEVFNADACGELIVHDAVEDGGSNASERDL